MWRDRVGTRVCSNGAAWPALISVVGKPPWPPLQDLGLLLTGGLLCSCCGGTYLLCSCCGVRCLGRRLSSQDTSGRLGSSSNGVGADGGPSRPTSSTAHGSTVEGGPCRPTSSTVHGIAVHHPETGQYVIAPVLEGRVVNVQEQPENGEDKEGREENEEEREDKGEGREELGQEGPQGSGEAEDAVGEAGGKGAEGAGEEGVGVGAVTGDGAEAQDEP